MPVEVVVAMLAIAVSRSTPLVLGALSGVMCERSGIVNIAIEGMMLAGAFAGFFVGIYTRSLLWALLAAVAVGMLLSALHAVLSIRFRVDQIISGTVINILAVGTTGFLNRALFSTGAPPGQAVLPNVRVPGLADLPLVGRVLFDQKPITYAAVLLVVLVHVVLFRTAWGLRVRAVGEHPLAADTVGIDVYRTRYLSVLVGGALAGLGGAYLANVGAGLFIPFISNGAGFLGIVLAMLARGRPVWVLFGALLFGVCLSLTTAMQVAGINIPTDVIQMLPFLAVMIMLVLFGRRASLPAALGIPYERGTR